MAQYRMVKFRPPVKASWDSNPPGFKTDLVQKITTVLRLLVIVSTNPSVVCMLTIQIIHEVGDTQLLFLIPGEAWCSLVAFVLAFWTKNGLATQGHRLDGQGDPFQPNIPSF